MTSWLPDPLYATAYSGVAVLLLTWIGNLVCRWLLQVTNLTADMEAKQAAAAARAAAQAATTTSPSPQAIASPPAAGVAAPQTQAAPQAGRSEPQVGAIIGAFERILLAIGILSGSWEVMAGVVALKTVARFKELDERLDAEYFLVGSLFSILWAIAITGAWIGYDVTRGLGLSTALVETIANFKGD